MKHCINYSPLLKKITFFLTAMMISVISFAQEKGLNIEIGVDKKEWYEQPWAWVIGAAVFILLLVAILRSGRKQ